jgi:hypothetical protein
MIMAEAADGDWTVYRGDLSNTRYAVHDQISTDDVKNLHLKVDLSDCRPRLLRDHADCRGRRDVHHDALQPRVRDRLTGRDRVSSVAVVPNSIHLLCYGPQALAEHG